MIAQLCMDVKNKNTLNATFRVSFVALGLIGFTQKIIDADIIKLSELNQNLRGNIICANFVFGIACLRHSEIISDLLLIQIVIGTQIANTMINHFHHPKTVYLT